MYLSKIKIENYRNCHKTTIDLDEGLNVIVGPNNSGKSNILNVIDFLNGNAHFSIDDINKNLLSKRFLEFKEVSPEIRIEYTIKHILDFSQPDSSLMRLRDFLVYNAEDGDLPTVQGETDKYYLEAKIILHYQLDSSAEQDYKTAMSAVDSAAKFIEVLRQFSVAYKAFFTDINSNLKNESVSGIFDIEYIKAVRHGDNIKPYTQQYIKRKITETGNSEELTTNINQQINQKLGGITTDVDIELDQDQDRIGITNGKNKFVSRFEFDSQFSQYFKYELKDIDNDYTLPVEYNGLGYNNLIELRNAIKQKESDDFNILLIEEPEAHLHPNMQYKLLKYINSLKVDGEGIKNQIIVTTHSPNVSASTKIENMIMVDYNRTNIVEEMDNVATTRMKEKFTLTTDDTFLNIARKEDEEDDVYTKYLKAVEDNLIHSKEHLEKFLDVTRSDLLFSNRAILVEGLAEKLLLPKFADMLGKDLTNEHIVTVEVGGVNFNNFIPIYAGTKKKVLCVSDCDFKYVLSDENGCLELNDLSQYDSLVEEKKSKFFHREFSTLSNIKLFTQSKYGSTFETELFLENYDILTTRKYLLSLALPKSLASFIDNISIDYWNTNIEIMNGNSRKKIKELLKVFYGAYSGENELAKKSLIEKLFFAVVFYSYAENKKGDLALAIATNDKIIIANDDNSGNTDAVRLFIPYYIKEGLEWLLQ